LKLFLERRVSMADDISYKIYGDDMQIVEIELDPSEGVRAEAGAMMFMDDAIRASIELMESDGDKLTIRSSYNLSAMSFAPEDVAKSIQATIPSFTISYDPDFRQAIADSWPSSIDDSQARKDWGWQPEFDLEKTSAEMLKQLRTLN